MNTDNSLQLAVSQLQETGLWDWPEPDHALRLTNRIVSAVRLHQAGPCTECRRPGLCTGCKQPWPCATWTILTTGDTP